jgi:Flp pilus assembly protein TadG
MKPPAILRRPRTCPSACRERGVTMVLVALALVAIIAMAALSIDVITLYLAREEAQRTADTAALAAARVISISGLTSDPNNSVSPSLWQLVCGISPPGVATQAATAVANQSAVGGAAASVTVTYSAAGTSSPDCTTFLPGSAFSVNPMVTVLLTRTSLPTFFSRIWGNAGNTVSATATAEAFNPSNSVNVGNQATGIVPVQPRCVKPWIVPNEDPLSLTNCGTNCTPFVNRTTGNISSPGISLNGGNSTGVIGERFWLVPDCHFGGATCNLRSPSATANYPLQARTEPPPNLEYAPGQTLYSSVAVPACSTGSSNYESAIAGCDQTTVYQCGVQSSSSAAPNLIDLSENPARGDTTNGVTCLINEGDAGDAQPDGQDTLNPYGKPSSYPFQILAGSSNHLGLTGGSPITSSNSIVSLPIYDDNAGNVTIGSTTTPVTILGFLQVFINSVDQFGNVDVTVLNVAGCSNGTGTPVGNPVIGSSPVPIRLITPE